MEIVKSFSFELGFSQRKMASSFGGALVFETLMAAQISLACLVMMTGLLLQDAHTLQNLIGNNQRFPFAELQRKGKTEAEAKDGSDTEDDDEDENDAEADDDGGDEDFSGEEGGEDGEEGDPEEDPEANGNQGSGDEDDDDGKDDDDEDDEDEEEEEEEEEEDDDEEQPPAKKRK